METTVEGNIVDIGSKSVLYGTVGIQKGKISEIRKTGPQREGAPFLLPGFIDAHVHIESSMLVPSEFAKLAVVHGTVATVSDPHEIANVCGLAGVRYMIDNGKTVPFKFNFGAPSCVPATTFETAGAVIEAAAVDALLASDDILYLSEMMNFPGVLNGDREVLSKIDAAKKYNKPVDGHAPGLSGKDAEYYIGAGISTDHECFTAEEALHKLRYGMKILIREGSAAKNFDALIHLLNDHEDDVMFCSDDKHPDSLVKGHINVLCKRAVAQQIDVFKVLKAACINPVDHYRLQVGLLRTGDPADFIVAEDLTDFRVIKTYINGQLVADEGVSKIKTRPATLINNFHCLKKSPADFAVSSREKKTPVIEAMDGQLITGKLACAPASKDGLWQSDVQQDILKMAVINRYRDAPVAIAFIKNFGLKKGAIASSVAHDSHNIIAVGVDDYSLSDAVNRIIDKKGGISIANADDGDVRILPLPVAGLMSVDDGYEVARMYTEMDTAAKQLGSRLSAPFMTLSFMALLVIPHLKLSDKGLFDGDRFDLLAV